MAAKARLQEAPGQPMDGDGPVFKAPWEASAFAMVVKLSDSGHFTWPEWVDCLSAVIAEGDGHDHQHHHHHHEDDEDDHHHHEAADYGSTYYRQWFAALERLLAAKGLLDEAAMDARHQYLRDNPVPHDHVARREPVIVA